MENNSDINIMPLRNGLVELLLYSSREQNSTYTSFVLSNELSLL